MNSYKYTYITNLLETSYKFKYNYTCYPDDIKLTEKDLLEWIAYSISYIPSNKIIYINAARYAVIYGYIDILKVIYDKKPLLILNNINLHDFTHTLQFLAIKFNHLNILKYIHNIDPTILKLLLHRTFENTPAHYAVSSGHLDIVKYFYTLKPEWFKTFNKWDCIPIYYAAIYGYYDIIKFIYDTDPDILYITDNNGDCIIHDLISDLNSSYIGIIDIDDITNTEIYNKYFTIIKYLHETTPELFWVKNNLNIIPLDLLSPTHYISITNYLKKPYTPLMHAIENNNINDVIRLLKKGADPNVSIYHNGHIYSALSIINLKNNDINLKNNDINLKNNDISTLITNSLTWTPKSHYLFSKSFQRGIIYILSIKNNICIPIELLFRICSFLPRTWRDESNSLNFNKHESTTILN